MLSLTASMTLLTMALSAASAPIPAPDGVTFGDLTTPSQGNAFSDFRVSVPESPVSRREPGDAEYINPWNEGDRFGGGGSFKRDGELAVPKPQVGIELNYDGTNFERDVPQVRGERPSFVDYDGSNFKRDFEADDLERLPIEGKLELNYDGTNFKRDVPHVRGEKPSLVNYDGSNFKRDFEVDGLPPADKLELNFDSGSDIFKRHHDHPEFHKTGKAHFNSDEFPNYDGSNLKRHDGPHPHHDEGRPERFHSDTFINYPGGPFKRHDGPHVPRGGSKPEQPNYDGSNFKREASD